MSKALEPYQTDLIKHAMSVGALKFGQFTLKSGRQSPYFINAGLLSSGAVLSDLATAYAQTISDAVAAKSNPVPQYEVIFGPAYKGIPFAACTALVLHKDHHVDVGFAYNRKEVKDHGEGGTLVGAPVKGKRVLVLDDVMTTGKAVREAIDLVRSEGGQVVGVVQLLDREEVGRDGVSSTIKDLEALVGIGTIKSVLKMRDLMAWLESNGMNEDLERMRAYREEYGIKG